MKDKLNTNLGNIIYIYNVLKKYSDEEHILSVKDIIKYVKEEKCGSYQIKHEYYVKDKENNLTLENTVSENIVSNVIVGTIIEADKLNQIPENNGKSYTFLEHTGNIIIEENVTKEITIKYVRDKEYGSYKVKHNYYVKDKNGRSEEHTSELQSPA